MNKLFPIIILAGGLATRLGLLSQSTPKSMMLVDNEPFIAHQLRLLKKNGFEKVILCIGYLGDLIQNYVKKGKQFGLSVAYSNDGPHLLGTAGALNKASRLLEEDFFVLYGDSYLTIDYKSIQNFFEQQTKPVLMTIFKNNNEGDSSNIELNHNRIIIYDKENRTNNMNYIDFGLALFKKSYFLNKNCFTDLTDLYQRLIAENRLAHYEVFQKFYEIGSVKGLNELSYLIKQRKVLV